MSAASVRGKPKQPLRAPPIFEANLNLPLEMPSVAGRSRLETPIASPENACGKGSHSVTSLSHKAAFDQSIQWLENLVIIPHPLPSGVPVSQTIVENIAISPSGKSTGQACLSWTFLPHRLSSELQKSDGSNSDVWTGKQSPRCR
jgi:hypothetical protein